jgi:septum formation inhibitor MinC
VTAPNCDDDWTDSVPLAAPASLGGTPSRPAAVLRGGARGLEIFVWGKASTEAIGSALAARLAEAPGFFRGSDARIRIEDGPLAPGCLNRLEAIASQFELHLVEVSPVRAPVPEAVPAIPRTRTSVGSSPPIAVPDPMPVPEAVVTPAVHADSIPIHVTAPVVIPRVVDAPSAPLPSAPMPVPTPMPIEETLDPRTFRTIVGPIRSGVVLEHLGHLVVFGDVNPGAEVRSTGNIIVLGRLRGTAHAGIGADTGFILALKLEAQQIRICRQVARAGDSDSPGTDAEIAYLTNGTIMVDSYQGRLPHSLLASI